MSDPSQPMPPEEPDALKSEAQAIQKFNLGCLLAISAPFLLAGLVMLVVSLFTWDQLDTTERIVLLVLGVVFTGVGVVPLGASQLRSGWIASQLKLQKDYPGQPWKWREDWDKGVIEQSGASKRFGHWVKAGVLIIVWGALIAQRDQVPGYDALAAEHPLLFQLLIALAIILPVSAVGRAIYTTLQARKSRGSTFVMSKVPCHLGGNLSGQVQTTLQQPPSDGVTLTLECVRLISSRNGGRRTEKKDWSDERSIGVQHLGQGPNGVTVPVEFQIPADATATGRISPDVHCVWRLVATASTAGADYRAEFEPPVFQLNAEGRVDDDAPNPM